MNAAGSRWMRDYSHEVVEPLGEVVDLGFFDPIQTSISFMLGTFHSSLEMTLFKDR